MFANIGSRMLFIYERVLEFIQRGIYDMKKRFVLVLITMICLTMFSGGILAYAKERESAQPTYYKYYTSIRVESGDTLWGIADRYLCEQTGSHEEYIREVMKMNDLKSADIRTGDSLIVFYYSTELK